MEPEPRRLLPRPIAAADAPGQGSDSRDDKTVEEFRDTERRLTRWFARWCQLGERLRARCRRNRACYYGEAGESCAISEHKGQRRRSGLVQRFSRRDIWPRLAGNCHTHRHTERAILDAGSVVDSSLAEWHFRLRRQQWCQSWLWAAHRT